MTDEDREMRRRNARNNYQRHRVARRKYAREYYQLNKERIKRQNQEWRERNPEKVRQAIKNYAALHPEQIKATKRRYYQRTREQRLQDMRDYDKSRGPQYGYKLRRAGFAHLADQVVKRAGGKCEWCGVTGTPERGKRKLVIHRIDGDDENKVLENLTMICTSCRFSTHNRGENHPQWKGDAASPRAKAKRGTTWI